MLDSVSSMTVRSCDVAADLRSRLVLVDLAMSSSARLAQHRVGADPEGGVVVRHALVDDVLEVGRGAGDAARAGCGDPGKALYGVWATATSRVLRLLQQVDEAQAVLGQRARCRRRGSGRSRGPGPRGRRGPPPCRRRSRRPPVGLDLAVRCRP